METQKTATYKTLVIGEGMHASLEITDEILQMLGANKRAPLKITINGYTYQSTATGVGGKCMVVFPMRDRAGAGVESGDMVEITLELDAGYRAVGIPEELVTVLEAEGLGEVFHDQSYSKRKEWVRMVAEAKGEDTRKRRISRIMDVLRRTKMN